MSTSARRRSAASSAPRSVRRRSSKPSTRWSRPTSGGAAMASASSTLTVASVRSRSRRACMALFRVNLSAPETPVLKLANIEDVEKLGARLDGVKLVVLEFPKFTDGRAYSQARILRERLGYTGELRASGAVFLDQLPFLLRCGFDAFESEQKGFGAALARARTL